MPQRAASVSGRSPKRDRRKTPARIDQRSTFAKRVAALSRLFVSQLGGGELTPLRALKIEQAATALAVAEIARGKYAKDGEGALDALVAAERRADGLIRRLGLPLEESTPALPASAAPDLSFLSDEQVEAGEAMAAEAEARENAPRRAVGPAGGVGEGRA